MGACQSASALPVSSPSVAKPGATVATAAAGSSCSTLPNQESDVNNNHDRHEKKVKTAAAAEDVCGLKELSKSMKANGGLNETVVRMETPIGIQIENVYSGVHDGEVLGSGVSGIVRRVKHRATGIEYASKAIDLGLIRDEESLRQLRNEISIMCTCDHPNIVRLEEVYEGEHEIYLVQELCEGGDLFDRLDEMPDYHYTENQCARLVRQMLSSLLYLHGKKIIHRDLKLENFLFSSRKADSELKLIDFGLSKHFQFGEVQHESVGTPYTVAPEIIRGSYDERSDVWAIGVITYLLLSGETPFGGCDGENLLQVRDNILRGSYAFEPTEYWEHVSDLSKEFIDSLLVVDYRTRPSAKSALRHEWIERVTNGNDPGGDNSVHGNHLNPNVVSALVSFKEYSDMRKLLLEILSFTLLPEQIVSLKSDFEKLDADGDGEISLEELKQMLVENAEAGSLGALTEDEVEQIFDAMRVRKTETTIRWHEFVAAGLSQCKVDERNLRLAFDRLDTGRKGYITFDDIEEMVGSNGDRAELHKMWVQSVKNECRTDVERIHYDDFVLLMKGQTRETVAPQQQELLPPEDVHEEGANIPPGDYDEMDSDKGDTEEAEISNEKLIESIMLSTPPRPTRNVRARSMDHTNSQNSDISDGSMRPVLLRADTMRAVLIAGRRGSSRKSQIDRVIEDETKSPLVVNRTLYRSNREMRLAVLEASKRFEDNQARHEKKGAALVMRRRGTGDSTDKQEARAVASAMKRSGRTRRYRTCSDLTGMVLA